MGQKEARRRVPMVRCTQLDYREDEYVFGCGWVSDIGDALLDSAGVIRCPKCGGRAFPTFSTERPTSARR